MRIATILIAALAGFGSSAAQSAPPAYHFIPGAVPLDAAPDGNTIILDAPEGLIVIDTGRHPRHSAKILTFAEQRRKPIAAILNTHWHLDHTTGNWDLLNAYPNVQIYATNALEGALKDFLQGNREQARANLAKPDFPAARKAQIARGRVVIDYPDLIRPNHVVSQSGKTAIAGRPLDLHVAPFAATEADLWIYDPKTKVAIVGDLVVGIVPFLDTACAEGWRKALNDIAKVPFTTLIPGHGDPMTRADFSQWKKAYDNLLDCTSSSVSNKECVARWDRDAAKFIDIEHREYVDKGLDEYITERLRAPKEQETYCKPL